MEKKLEGQEDLAFGFVSLEKTFNAIPREVVMATQM